MLSTARSGCADGVRAASLVLILGWEASSASSQTVADHQSRSVCACPDGRQFSTGSSLSGKNSARVVITDFRRDLGQATQHQGLPTCKDILVVGQTVHLETFRGHPYLRRENQKRGTIADICQTKIQFTEPKNYYDFFKDDGSAVSISDVEVGQTPPENEASADSSVAEGSDDRGTHDLTGKDLIGMVPVEQQDDDPGTASFDADDLKEGAYFILRRQLKAVPAVDDSNGANVGIRPNVKREVTVWAGSLGRIEKRAGFRDGPLWLVEVLPNSAPAAFSSYLRSLPATFRKHGPPQNKFVLASEDIVEINHFLDKYSLEWTHFGDDSEDARKREFAGTTILPDIYSTAQPPLQENLENAWKTSIESDIRKAAMRLIFSLKNPQPVAGDTLVLDEESSLGIAAPHFFHKQCFVGQYELIKTAGSSALRVTDADLAVFQPSGSPQVPNGYYAIDLRLQLKSDSGRSMRIVCRFPSAAVEGTLLDSSERILSRIFSIASATR